MAKATDITQWLGDKFNKKQSIVGLPAGPAGDDPGILFLESRATAVGAIAGVYVWADSSGNIRYSTTLPTTEASDGSAVATTAASSANVTLSNLGTTSINTTLKSDTDATDDLGSASYYWRRLYCGRTYLNSTSYLDGTTAGVATLTGDLLTADGMLNFTTTTDETSYIKRNLTGSTSAVFEVEQTHTGDAGVALLVDANANGAYDAVNITHDGTGSALKITSTATTATQLSIVGVSRQTTSLVVVDGSTTDGFYGATGVGMVHLKSDGTQAHAGASLLQIVDTGTSASAATGSSLRINDAATAGNGASVAAYIYSASQNALSIKVNTATMYALKLDTGAAGTAAMMVVDATGWIGASTVGCIAITGDGVLEAGASLVNVTSTAANTAASWLVDIESSGNVTNSTLGICLHVVEAGTLAGTSYAGYFASSANSPFGVYHAATTTPAAKFWGIQAQATSILVIDATTGTGWVGATGVGALHIKGDGTLAHANASMLLIANSGATSAAAALGSSLRITDTSGASSGGYVEYIGSTNNALLCLDGTAVAKTQLTVLTPASQVLAAVQIGGAATTWIGATGVGMLQLDNAGTLAHVNASLCLITNSGIPKNDHMGHCLRIVDTGNAAAGTMAYPVYVGSADATVGGIYVYTNAASIGLNVARGTAVFAEIATFTTGLKTIKAVTNCSTATAPTNAECITAFGTAATTGSGFIGVLDENNADTNVFFVCSNGTQYHWVMCTKAA